MNDGYVSTCFNHNLPTFHLPSSSHLLEKPQWHSPAGDALIDRAVAVVGEPMAGAVATAGAAQGKIGMGQNLIPWGHRFSCFFLLVGIKHSCVATYPERSGRIHTCTSEVLHLVIGDWTSPYLLGF